MLLRIAVHEESTPAEGVGVGGGREPENIRPVIFGVDGRADDGPIACRDGADVSHTLKNGIVLAVSGARVSGGHVRAVLFEVAGFLGVSPGLTLEIVRRSFEVLF